MDDNNSFDSSNGWVFYNKANHLDHALLAVALGVNVAVVDVLHLGMD